MHPATVIPKMYVLGSMNWLLPASVSFTATPKPLMAMTETEPTSEHIEMYTMGFVRPYLGATRYIITRLKTRTVKQYIMKPGDTVSFGHVQQAFPCASLLDTRTSNLGM